APVAAQPLRTDAPRLLVFDKSQTASGSATGELKASLFADWPAERFLQVGDIAPARQTLTERRASGGFATREASADEIAAATQRFRPDVVLYRPVPDTPVLHGLAMRHLRAADVPLVTWLMDDWPDLLSVEDPAQWARLGPDLLWLLGRSTARLSICQAMSEAFFRRYGHGFTAVANGVDPADWPARARPDRPDLLLRYGGGLAENMSLKSVLRLARVVDRLAGEGIPIRFEINTQSWWHDRHAPVFADFAQTTVEAVERSQAAYRRWLQEADVLVIAYNFDAETLRYVRYSMANKMPECLVSGAVLLAHGPREIATIRYLAETGVAETVTEADEDTLAAALRRLATDAGARQATAAAARSHALARHALAQGRQRLNEVLSAAARGTAQAVDAPAAPIAGEGGELPADLAPLEAVRALADGILSAPATVAPDTAALFVDRLSSLLLLDPDAVRPDLDAGAPIGRALAQVTANRPSLDSLRDLDDLLEMAAP
ncbi:MAG: hypothetical protein AAF677_18635, partial [Pseudomonadota bacterium]